MTEEHIQKITKQNAQMVEFITQHNNVLAAFCARVTDSEEQVERIISQNTQMIDLLTQHNDELVAFCSQIVDWGKSPIPFRRN
jgi:thiamine biosynthesis protein ThiC